MPKFGTPEELEDDEPQQTFYAPGDIGKMALTVLKELVDNRAPETARAHLTKFLDFIPPDQLEEFLVKCIEYGADKVLPQKKTVRRTTG